MRRSTRALLVALGVVVVVAGAAALRHLHDASTPVAPAGSLVRFRAEIAAGDTAIPLGRYAYRTTGSETASALGGRPTCTRAVPRSPSTGRRAG